jgi:hypothetical protein
MELTAKVIVAGAGKLAYREASVDSPLMLIRGSLELVAAPRATPRRRSTFRRLIGFF